MSRPALMLGIQVAEKAVDEDGKKNYKEAMDFYLKAARYFRYALKHERYSDDEKVTLHHKINGYQARANLIQSRLKEREERIKRREERIKRLQKIQYKR